MPAQYNETRRPVLSEHLHMRRSGVRDVLRIRHGMDRRTTTAARPYTLETLRRSTVQFNADEVIARERRRLLAQRRPPEHVETRHIFAAVCLLAALVGALVTVLVS